MSHVHSSPLDDVMIFYFSLKKKLIQKLIMYLMFLLFDVMIELVLVFFVITKINDITGINYLV